MRDALQRRGIPLWLLAPWTVALLIALVGIGLLLAPRSTTAEPSKPALAGTALKGEAAPDFRLRDQWGKSVSLAGLRGRLVVMTFTEAHCTELCPIVAESLHRVAESLGPLRHRVEFLALSTDPEGDTPSAVRAFSRQHDMLSTWKYLVGPRQRMQPIWNAYHLYVAPPTVPESQRGTHTSATFVIDARGRERVLMGNDPSTDGLVRDLRILAGLPVAGSADLQISSPEPGHHAPDLTLSSLRGGTVSLRGLRGHVVLLNFWKTDCPACLSEMPRLSSWYGRLKRRGLTILGVDDGEGRDVALPYVHKLHVSYPILLDGNGDVSARFDAAWLPRSILVNANGTVVTVHLGPIDNAWMTQHVEPLLHS